MTKIAHRHGENREPRKRDWRHIHHSPLFWVFRIPPALGLGDGGEWKAPLGALSPAD